MKQTPEPALLLEGANSIEADLAKDLLAEAGIPTLTRGPDFDVAELGRAAHDMLRGTDLYVPASALEKAREILRGAWGEDALDAGRAGRDPGQDPGHDPGQE